MVARPVDLRISCEHLFRYMPKQQNTDCSTRQPVTGLESRNPNHSAHIMCSERDVFRRNTDVVGQRNASFTIGDIFLATHVHDIIAARLAAAADFGFPEFGAQTLIRRCTTASYSGDASQSYRAHTQVIGVLQHGISGPSGSQPAALTCSYYSSSCLATSRGLCEEGYCEATRQTLYRS